MNKSINKIWQYADNLPSSKYVYADSDVSPIGERKHFVTHV